MSTPSLPPAAEGSGFVRKALALTAGAVVLVLAAPGFLPMANPDRLEADRATGAVNTLRMALEQYGTDHQGKYPPPAWMAAALTKPGTGYMPGDRLPANPWSPTGAPMQVYRGKWPAGVVSAATLAGGTASPTPPGTALGPGRFPGQGPDDHLTYGTILYDYEPNQQHYVIYVVGKRGDRAVLLNTASNGSR